MVRKFASAVIVLLFAAALAPGQNVKLGSGVTVGSASSYGPNDTSYISMRQDFLGGGSSCTSDLLAGWIASSIVSGGTCSTTTGSAPNVGQAKLTTAATTGDGYDLQIPGNGYASFMFAPGATTNWTFTFIVEPSATGAGTIRVRAGTWWHYDTTIVPTSGIYFRYDTDAAIADTDWMGCVNSSSTETCADTGVAPSSSSFSKLVMSSSTTGKISFSVDGSTAVTICASGCTVTGTPPTGNLAAQVNVAADQATAYSVNWDFFAGKLTVSR